MNTNDLQIRRAVLTDAPIMAQYRAAMFRDIGWANEQDAAAIEAAALPVMQELLARDEYLGWVVECAGQVVGCGGVQMRRLLPRPGHLQGGAEAYILNVYTRPEYRRQGLARKLMEEIIGWAKQSGCARITLHTSEDGRALYESLGFVRTQEMRLRED